jgi:hypothetical protein
MKSKDARNTFKCPLCGHPQGQRWQFASDKREYVLCGQCALVWVPAAFLPTDEEEKNRYLHHQNRPDDPGYRAFLQQALSPTLPHLTQGVVGLDYGCGPSPTLWRLLEEQGITCHNYDPVFGFTHPHQAYDFVISTEVVEHFHHPGREWEKMVRLVKPGGLLTVMTEWWTSREQFAHWYYKRDSTHVAFYAESTFRWIAARWSLEILHTDKQRVVVMRKPGSH